MTISNNNELAEYLHNWIKAISDNPKTTDLSVRRHIVKHAKQIYSRDPKLWAASMRNLVEIFECYHKIIPSKKLQIERLQNKFNKNSTRYTPPPKIIHCKNTKSK